MTAIKSARYEPEDTPALERGTDMPEVQEETEASPLPEQGETVNAEGAEEEETAAKTAEETQEVPADTGLNETEGKTTLGIPEVTQAPKVVTATATPTPAPVPPKEKKSVVPYILIPLLVFAVAFVGYLLYKKLRRQGIDDLADTDSNEATEALTGSGVSVRPTVLALSVGGAQTIGRRPNQEDALCYSNWTNRKEYLERGFLAAVADGIGGLENSELASQTAMKNMRARFQQLEHLSADPADTLLSLAGAAQNDVLALNRSRVGAGMMGTTLVSVLIYKDMLWHLSIGDSRIYLYRGGAVLPLNRPHVFGKENREEYALNVGGRASDARQDKKLTAYVGQENLRKVDRNVNPIKLLSGDRVLLMTDGVFGTLGEEAIVGCMRLDPQKSAEEIIARVESYGKPHQDNATAVVVCID